jgi:4-hydroxy-3-polyprenylbenzoate decarboxylase
MDEVKKRYILAITGATGVQIGLRVFEVLSKEAEVHLIVSQNAIPIIRQEAELDLSVEPEERLRRMFGENVYFYMEDNLWAPMASGSFKTEGMLIVPCSMKTLSAVANGYANGLIERAADVTIKERRLLLLSPRETPLSVIHLENMLKLARIGVRIVPPVVGFYHRPSTVDDIIDFIAGKILDQIGINHGLYRRWS